MKTVTDVKIMTKHLLACAVSFAVLTVLVPGSSHAAEFTFFGEAIIPTWTNATGWDVSADGSTVVGQATYISSDYSVMLPSAPVKWSSSSGMTIPGGLADAGVAYAVSSDGSVIAGGIGNDAYKWSESTGAVTLESGSVKYATVKGMTSDGSTLVGQVTYENNEKEAVMWDAQGNMTVLGDLSGGDLRGEAIRISDDGSIILGNGAGEAGGTEAVIWKNGVIQSLGDLEGGRNYSEAHDMTPDGSVVVGASSGDGPNGESEAFVWTEENGMIGLGDLFPEGYDYSSATAVSADGSIIAGVTRDNIIRSFLYSEDSGLVFLDELLAESGIDLTGWVLAVCGMSADGTVLTGYAVNLYDTDSGQFAWVANLNASAVPVPGTVWLLGSGLLGIIGIHRHKKQNS